MLTLHNKFREMETLPPLIGNESLDRCALKHAKRMARLNWLSDYKLDDLKNNLNGYQIINYSLSIGSSDEVAIKKLVNDKDNRDKILGDFQHLGFGSFKSKTEIRYWCILYGKLKGETND